MLPSIRNVKFIIKMRWFTMLITAVCVVCFCYLQTFLNVWHLPYFLKFYQDKLKTVS